MTHVRALAPGLDLLALHRRAPARYPLLLESAAHGTAQGRWDMLLAADGPSLALHADGRTRRGDGTVVEGDFLSALDARWKHLRLPREEPRWPFRGGWALLLGYELGMQVEPVLQLPPAPGGLPVGRRQRVARVAPPRADGRGFPACRAVHRRKATWITTHLPP